MALKSPTRRFRLKRSVFIRSMGSETHAAMYTNMITEWTNARRWLGGKGPQHIGKSIGVADMKGQVWLLNAWASWCASCRTEHPLLVELAKAKIAPIVGLNYKDKPEEAKVWLGQLGDPYSVSVMDRDSRVGFDLGVYGVPETFVIDQTGTIRYKQIGPVTADSLEKKIIPMIRKLQQL